MECTKGEWKWDVWHGKVLSSNGDAICAVYEHDGGASIANARLIAAAPELYETLKLIFEAQEIDGDRVVTRTVPSSADVMRIKQALAKAEGA